MSQNQFPGQNPQPGGQPYPQGGQPQLQPGGQPYPQGGQPYLQPGGQPYPQGGQPNLQPGGQPYPQGGQPHPQSQYPPAGGQYGQVPLGAQAGPQAGFQPPPPKPKGNGMIIGVVVAALVAVGLAGWLLMILFGGGNEPAPTPSPTVTSTSAPTPVPSATASTAPSPSATASPTSTASPTTGTPAGALEVGLGVSVTPADGWAQTSRNEIKNYTELSNGKALLATQAFQVQGQVTGKDVVAAYLKQITESMTGATTTKQPATLDVKADRLSVGIAGWSGTRATAQGSVKLQYVSIISVRDDGLAVMSTLIVPSGSTVSAQQADYLAMTNSLLSSQLQA